MRRTRTALGALVTLAVIGGGVASAIHAAGNAITARAGNLLLHAEGTVIPQALPRGRFAPISLRVRESVATLDGSHVPAAQTVELRVDRHFRIETTGLPSCSLREIRASSPSQALRACGGALLGDGYATAEVAFPEQAPFTAKGRLLAFNGPRVGGYPEQLYYIYADVPAPTAIVVTAKFSRGSGPYGYDVSVTVPKIAGGAGSLASVDFRLDRRWSYKGVQRSYLSGECPNGHFSDQFQADFADGTVIAGSAISSCRPRG